MKKCARCHITKPSDEFSKNKRKKDGLATRCKQCKSELHKLWYNKNKKYVKEYRDDYKSYGHGLWLDFTKHKSNTIVEISEQEFIAWYNKQEKACYYCGNEFEVINKYLNHIKVERKMARLEYDRLDSNDTYNINNIVLACHICNAHKRDFFSQKEFKEIAEKFISPKIKRFISNQGLK